MRKARVLAPVLAIALIGCGNASTGSNEPTPAVAADGITLTTSTHERLSGSYSDAAGNLLRFETARIGDDLYFDLTGIGGRKIIHIETVGESYEFSYMDGALKMHTTKTFVAQARAQAEAQPDGVSTDGFVFEGDTHALDAMLQLPEVAQLPALSRALGVRGITGSDFPATAATACAARAAAAGAGCAATAAIITAAPSTTAGAARASGTTATTSRPSSRSSVADRRRSSGGGRARRGRPVRLLAFATATRAVAHERHHQRRER